MNDYITPREISNQLNISYGKALELLQSGALRAEKVKNRWKITLKQFESFKASNVRKIKALQSTYVDLYWQGTTHYQLQKHVANDFKKNHIVAPVRGFAETAVYEAVKGGNQFDSR